MEMEARICVVDDDPVVHAIIQTALQPTGWHITTYSSGVDFVQALEDGKTWDLVFLDLIMPQMNGFAVLQFMDSQSIEIPVIVLTALSRTESVVKATEFGIKSYITKPIKPDGILKKTAEILNTNF